MISDCKCFAWRMGWLCGWHCFLIYNLLHHPMSVSHSNFNVQYSISVMHRICELIHPTCPFFALCLTLVFLWDLWTRVSAKPKTDPPHSSLHSVNMDDTCAMAQRLESLFLFLTPAAPFVNTLSPMPLFMYWAAIDSSCASALSHSPALSLSYEGP